jgi:hypothetical protein
VEPGPAPEPGPGVARLQPGPDRGRLVARSHPRRHRRRGTPTDAQPRSGHVGSGPDHCGSEPDRLGAAVSWCRSQPGTVLKRPERRPEEGASLWSSALAGGRRARRP